MGTSSLPHCVRPPQVLLGVGAVLLVTAGAAAASSYGGLAVRLLLLALAGGAAAASLLAARLRLASSAEMTAGAAAGLALTGSGPAGLSLDGEPVSAAALAVGFLLLHRVSPDTAAWPLAAWGAGQLAVLRVLDDVPAPLQTAAYLGVVLLGLGILLTGRPAVARTTLATTAPWWAATVVTGTVSAWQDGGARGWWSALLVVVAAVALLPARLREPLDPFLGPPPVVPVVAGIVAGIGVVGPVAALDPVVLAGTGFGGVLLATVPAAVLTGWRRGLLARAGTAAGVVVAGLCVVQLAAGGRWSALALLLLLTAAPTNVVAARRDDRPVALPLAVGCLAGAVLLALPDRHLPTGGAAALLTALYTVALAVGSGLDAGSRRATARAAALVGVAAALLLLVQGNRPGLALCLAVQAAATLGWAWRAGGRDPALGAAAWRAGAGQLVAAAWVAAAAADLAAVEWYSLSAAGGLLIAAGRRLGRGRSWPAWGPGLVVAAAPSAVLAVIGPDGPRTVAVLTAAAAVMVAGARRGVRAPLVVGSSTALWVTVGFAVQALPWPLATALVVGSLLLAVGMRRERRPVAGFRLRFADLR